MVVDVVSVWLIGLRLPPVQVAALAAVLDGDERRRAEGLPADRRDAHVIAHGALRQILGQRLGLPPAALVWELGPHGKPELSHRRHGDSHAHSHSHAHGPSHGHGQAHGHGRRQDPVVRFNLSHSGELATVAVTESRSVGVDVQERRRMDVSRLATRFYPADEARFVLAGTGPEERADRFHWLWTRKEACVKCAGGRLLPGLSVPVRDPEGLVRGPAGSAMLVRDVPVPEGFRAAVALAGTAPFRITRRWWEPPP